MNEKEVSSNVSRSGDNTSKPNYWTPRRTPPQAFVSAADRQLQADLEFLEEVERIADGDVPLELTPEVMKAVAELEAEDRKSWECGPPLRWGPDNPVEPTYVSPQASEYGGMRTATTETAMQSAPVYSGNSGALIACHNEVSGQVSEGDLVKAGETDTYLGASPPISVPPFLINNPAPSLVPVPAADAPKLSAGAFDAPCTPAFRDLCLRVFRPRSPAQLSFLSLMLFSSNLDEETDAVLVSQYTLAKCEGKESSVQSGNYCGRKFLDQLKHELFRDVEFSWTEASYKERKCRTATVKWPKEIVDALHAMSGMRPDASWVMFCSGARLTKRHRAKLRDSRRDAAIAEAVDREWRIQSEILDYLNNLHPRRFDHLRKNTGFGRDCAAELREAACVNDETWLRGEGCDADEKFTERAYRQQLLLLQHIAMMPQPFYGVSEKETTDRIWAHGASACGLKREIRKAICSGWWDSDLKCAQLAILAKLWSLPKISAFLKNRGCIWSELMNHLAVPAENRDKAKYFLKKVLYSLAYGASKRSVRAKHFAALQRLGVADPDALFKHDLIKELWDGRNRKTKEVMRAGMLRMHWGREVVIASDQDFRKRHAAVRSALACQAQAMELELLFPLYELAMRYPRDFQVMLHQHDGVTICFSRRVEQWKERIEKAVAARAKELDLHTYLEWERL